MKCQGRFPNVKQVTVADQCAQWGTGSGWRRRRAPAASTKREHLPACAALSSLPVDASLHGAEGDVEAGGDLREGEPFPVLEPQGLLELGAEAGNGPVELLLLHEWRDRVGRFARRGGKGVDVCAQIPRARVSLPAPQVIEGGAPHDGGQP